MKILNCSIYKVQRNTQIISQLNLDGCGPNIKLISVFTGTKEIVAGVDEETGDIFLSLEACEICETSKFVWSKNYKPIGDCPRVAVTTEGRT